MKKRLSILCIFLFIMTAMTGCSKKASSTELIFDTIVNVTIYGSKSQKQMDAAVQAAMDRMRQLEKIFSANSDDSELSYINQNAAKGPVKVSKDMYTVLEASLSYANMTDGAFDPTLGKLIQLWGIGTDNARVPSAEELEPYMNRKNYKNILLDKEAQTVCFTTDQFSLELGGIAKGYAADEMKKLLVDEYQIKSALLNLGGNIITIGAKPDGNDWTLGIADPKAPEDTANPALILKTTGQTMVTSGNYQRYFTGPDGVRYHHILDGTTGYPANNDLASTTIITDCSMDADALSTAAFVLGQEKGSALINSIDSIEAVFIDEQGKVTVTKGLTDKIHEGSLKPDK